MIDPTWRLDEPEDSAATATQPALVSLHFLRAELRRRWRTWVALGCVGMFLALAWTIVLPAKSVGTATLLLAHDPQTDPDQAMSTDVSLLRTRTVAAAVVDRLDLDMTPEDFQESVAATPVSSSVLELTVAAPHDAAAVARTRALATAYLSFRTEQIQSQTQALVEGYQRRLALMRRQIEDLTRQFSAIDGNGPVDRSRATDLLARRSQVNSDMSSLQQTVQDANLNSGSLVAASYVIDPAAPVPRSAHKRLALALASGLIGGVAVGMFLVAFTALTSDRLRRREDVALALGVPVRFSAGDLRRRRPWTWRPGRGGERRRDLQILVSGFISGISPPRRPPPERPTRKGQARKPPTPRKVGTTRMALATVDDVRTAGLVLAGVAAELVARGKSVFLVDLSESGVLEHALAGSLDEDHGLGSESGPVLFRPDGVPSLSRGPVETATSGTTDLPKADPRRRSWETADVILTLAEIDPAVGIDHLRSWADQVVLLVTAGQSSAERLRGTGELLRSADLPLLFAMMANTNRTDESLGDPDAHAADWAGARRTS